VAERQGSERTSERRGSAIRKKKKSKGRRVKGDKELKASRVGKPGKKKMKWGGG